VFKKFKANHEPTITALYNEKKAGRLEKYMSFEDTVVLCKKHHHFAEHGFVPCKECSKPTKPNSDGLCFDCLVKKGIVKKCPKCGKNWYRADKNDMCRDCAFWEEMPSEMIDAIEEAEDELFGELEAKRKTITNH